MPSQSDKLRKIERLIKGKLPKTDLPEGIPNAELELPKINRNKRNFHKSSFYSRKKRYKTLCCKLC